MFPNTFPVTKTVENDQFCIDYKQEGNGTFTPVYGIKSEQTTVEKDYDRFEIAGNIYIYVYSNFEKKWLCACVLRYM